MQYSLHIFTRLWRWVKGFSLCDAVTQKRVNQIEILQEVMDINCAICHMYLTLSVFAIKCKKSNFVFFSGGVAIQELPHEEQTKRAFK